ncbi:hypothetical protein KC336_g20121 [Hortaea werneckii]|nr:hypothetical protein KC336_g20121 [Hortaea werneckii]
MYSDKSLKAWQSTKWLPEGYVSRSERDPTYFERRRSSVMQGEGKKHEGSDSDDHLHTEPEKKNVVVLTCGGSGLVIVR